MKRITTETWKSAGLQRLQNKNLTLNEEKGLFSKTRIEFYGHVRPTYITPMSNRLANMLTCVLRGIYVACVWLHSLVSVSTFVASESFIFNTAKGV